MKANFFSAPDSQQATSSDPARGGRPTKTQGQGGKPLGEQARAGQGAAATEAVKEKAPEVSSPLTEPHAARHRDQFRRPPGRLRGRSRRRLLRSGAERHDRAGLVRRRRRPHGRPGHQRGRGEALTDPGARNTHRVAAAAAPGATPPSTTVASSLRELNTRPESPLTAKIPTVRGAWRRLVSISRWPPGASHSGAAAAPRRCNSSPSGPPSRETSGYAAALPRHGPDHRRGNIGRI